MDETRPAEVASPPEAVAFVRFCYRRRRATWPELYDEMCAVASRRLYNGWGFAELAEHGIGFGLFDTPALAAMAREVYREDAERRSRAAAAPAPVAETVAACEPVAGDGRAEAGVPTVLRLAPVVAG
jgi:hypothetical protein